MQRVYLTAIVPDEMAEQRLDKVLASIFPMHSRSRLQEWLKGGKILVDGRCLRAKEKVKGGETIVLDVELTLTEKDQPCAIALDIVYEDESILVINKPVGLVVHPGAGNPDKTLLNGLLHYLPQQAHLPRAGIVHRLDKDTSGVMVIAKTLTAHTALVSQLEARKIKREYNAITIGVMTAGRIIDAPIGRHPHHRTKMAVVKEGSGKEAITEVNVLERFRAHTSVRCQLQTGRTHQIRVHLAHIGYPLVGDATYGGRFKIPKGVSDELVKVLRNFKRQALHARRLTLVHPETKEKMSWQAPLPEDMAILLGMLRRDVE